MNDAPKLSPQARVIQMLMDRLADAKAGNVQSLVIGYTTPDGGASVEATPMSAVMLNHLSTLLQRRVMRSYDRAEQVRPTGPGVGAVPVTGTTDKMVPAASGLPRNTRRRLAKQIKKAGKAALKPSPANGTVPAAMKP